jgi:hypothetical protein
VLCQVVNGFGTDFEITGVDEMTLTVLFNRTYNFTQFDKPTAMTIDNGDIICAGYSEGSGDRQILMVRTGPSGVVFWGQAFGFTNRREIITDVLYYQTNDGFYRYGYCGYDESNNRALIGDVSPNGPQFGFSQRYVTSVDGQQRQTRATAMAKTDNSIFVCGMVDDVSPFIATYSKDLNLTHLNFRFHDDNEGSREELSDIYWNFGQPRVVAVGLQRLDVPWNSSPAGQDYSWIMTQTPVAFGGCRRSANALTSLFTGSTPVAIIPSGAGASGSAFTPFANQTFFTWADNCTQSMRLGAPAETAAAPAAEKVSAMFPNPGSDVMSFDATLAEGESATLRIVDLGGRVVHEQQLNAGAIRQLVNVEALADGAYCWSVTINGETVRSDRMIIAH